MGNHLIYNQICKVMDNKSKRIGTFKQFLKEQKQMKLNEERLSLEIEWWDAAQVEVMQDLADECNGFLDYDTLVKFVKNKFSILGRPDPGYPEGMLQQHIKDLIYSHHWSSNVFDGMCSWEEDQSQVQALGLAIGELSKVILDKVLETIKTSDDPIPGVTKISLVDKEPRTLVPMTEPVPDAEEDYMDDLPFEGKKTRPVKKFHEYTKSLNETVAFIDMPAHKKCINYCLDRIQNEVGSYDPDEIFNMACQEAKPKAKARMVLLYVKNMVTDYIANEKALFGMVDVTGKKGKDIPKEAWEEGLDILCQNIADEVLVALAEINGISLEDGETE